MATHDLDLFNLCCDYLEPGAGLRVASSCRVSQSTVTRWRSGVLPIPQDAFLQVVKLIDDMRKDREELFQKLDKPAEKYRKQIVTIFRPRPDRLPPTNIFPNLEKALERDCAPPRTLPGRIPRIGEPGGKSCLKCGASMLVEGFDGETPRLRCGSSACAKAAVLA